MLVVPWRVLRRDDKVGRAVVHQDLAAGLLELIQGVEAVDVERVQGGGSEVVFFADGGGAPGWVVVHDVAEPVFGVWEDGAGVVDELGDELAAGLHARVDEGFVVVDVQRGEDLVDGVDLGLG